MIGEESDEIDLSDLNLDPQQAEEIQKRVYAKCVANRDHFKKAMDRSNECFSAIYKRFSKTTNFASDSIRVFLRLHAVNDNN